MRDLIILAIETCMRRGELLSLDWTHINLESRVAHLPLTKNGESRDVPLSARATMALQGLRESQGAPSSGRALPRRTARWCKRGAISVVALR
jgi:integrase